MAWAVLEIDQRVQDRRQRNQMMLGSAVEPGSLRADMAATPDGLVESAETADDPPPKISFSYPRHSASYFEVVFWFAWIFAAGSLLPLLRHQATDPADGWTLFGLALFFGFPAFVARWMLKWIGTVITVDADGMTAVRRRGGRLHIPRPDLVVVRTTAKLRRVDFIGRDGTRISVWRNLLNYGGFFNEVLSRLRRNDRRS
ncbi:MAG TPA: hypothetical protein VGL65_06840 [Gemmatimonadales bacterium]|jgi:hypothetical protein